MVIESTISVGNLLQIVAMLAGGFYFLYTMKGEMSILTVIQKQFASRLDKIDQELVLLSKVTVDLARQDERMTAQDKRLQELSIRIDDLNKLTKLLLSPLSRARRSKD